MDVICEAAAQNWSGSGRDRDRCRVLVNPVVLSSIDLVSVISNKYSLTLFTVCAYQWMLFLRYLTAVPNLKWLYNDK
jgi:hypothetical protein